jgi:hypothetical protein
MNKTDRYLNWLEAIKEWDAEKKEFLNLPPAEKAKESIPFFKFTIFIDFGKLPTQKQVDDYVERATKFYEQNKDRMYPDLDVIYKKPMSLTNRWTFAVIANDVKEKIYFQNKSEN